jgi:secreted trypsin-like serine protease
MLASLVALALATAHAGEQAPAPDAAWGRIVNGHEARTGDFPATVALGFDLGGQRMEMCSASLITPQLVLTAGHCTEELAKQYGVSGDLIVQYMKVFVGNKVSASKTKAYGLASYRVHPDYGTDARTGSPRNDINLLVLAEPVTEVQPVWFRDTPLTTDDAVGATVTSVGYGITSSAAQTSNGVKRVADLVVSDLDDQFLYSRARQNPDEANVCSGDSGGPQYHLEGHRLVQWGVHSFVFSDQFGATDPCLVASGSTNVGSFASFVLKEVERVHGTTDKCAINGYYLDRTCDADCAEPDLDCDLDEDADGLVDDDELAAADADGDGDVTPDEADQFLNPPKKKGCDQSGGAPMLLGSLALLALRRRR